MTNESDLGISDRLGVGMFMSLFERNYNKVKIYKSIYW